VRSKSLSAPTIPAFAGCGYVADNADRRPAKSVPVRACGRWKGPATSALLHSLRNPTSIAALALEHVKGAPGRRVQHACGELRLDAAPCARLRCRLPTFRLFQARRDVQTCRVGPRPVLCKTSGRKFQCLDCTGDDPLRSPEVPKLLGGTQRLWSEERCRISFRPPQCLSFVESYSGIGFTPCSASITRRGHALAARDLPLLNVPFAGVGRSARQGPRRTVPSRLALERSLPGFQ
jgi:hypothetical protein